MKLTDTQSLILRQAAEQETGLAPLPKIPAAARNAVFRSMLKSGLLAEVPAPLEHVGHGWRQDEAGRWIALRITAGGLAAIGIDAAQEGLDSVPGASTSDVQQVLLDAANAPGGPPQSPEQGPKPQDAGVGRATLRNAATAVIAAWEAAQPLETALISLRASLAGRPARAARAASAPRKPREGTKQETVLALLRRPEGATVRQVMEATGWQQHTVRGFFAGLKRRQGIAVEVRERVRQVGPNKTGARGSYSIYQIAAASA